MSSTKKESSNRPEKTAGKNRSHFSEFDDEGVQKKTAEVERSLSIFINSIGDPIFVKDDQSRLLLVNDAFCLLFEMDRDRIIGQTLEQDVSPEERENFLKNDKQVLKDGIENISEESLTVRNGEKRIISTRKSRYINERKEKFLIGIIRDITDRTKSEQVLTKAKEKAEEYENRFHLLMQNMNAGVNVHAPDSRIVHSNARASEIMGLSEDQMKGKKAVDPDWKFVYPDNSPMKFDDYPVNQILRSRKPLKNFEGGIYQPGKNEVRWVSVNGFPVFNPHGELIEIVVVLIDVTEQKQREAERLADKLNLEKTKKQLNHAQKMAHIGSWVFYPKNQKAVWSDEMFRIWDFDPEKGTPSHSSEISGKIHPDDLKLFNQSFEDALNKGKPYDIEFRIRISNEEERVLRSICQPNLGDDGSVKSLSGTNQDITPQKKFEEAQVKHERVKAIGEMSASVAHDFNNALQEMMGNIEVIKMENQLSGDSLDRLNNLSSIIGDTASRVSALQKFGDPTNRDNDADLLNLNDLIEESIAQSRPLWKDEMEKKGLKISVKTDFQEIPKIRCNHGEIKSVVFNLIKNSVEAMPQGGELLIRTGTKSGRTFASFADTGVGMDAEAEMKIFEPFFTTKGFNPGRGLGMSGVYAVMKKCQGDVAVKSTEKGKGTVIEIKFPLTDQTEQKKTSVPENDAKKHYRVLWVDDDFIITASSRKMVQSLGHTCTAVNTGKKALAYLNENPCDLVFTDIGMPEMNGRELAAAIRKQFGEEIKIIAVTGWNMKDVLSEEHAINGFLQKPFTMADLKRALIEISTAQNRFDKK